MCKKVLILLIVGLLAGVAWADSGPVHSYTFEDGTANDSVGEAHGTLVGGAAIVDGAMVTTAQNQWMEMPGDVIDFNSFDAVTIEAWFTPTAGANTGWSMLAYFGGSSEPNIGGVGINGYFMTIARQDDKSRAAISTGDLASPWADETGADGVEYDDGLLHHMVSTLDANEITLYIDGELQARTPMDAHNSIHDLDNDYALLAKGGYSGDPEWIGAIHEFNIYNRTLLLEEIQALYMGTGLDIAFGPSPSDGAIEVRRDVVLSWKSGSYAVTHDVYFGTDVNDVNEASKDDTRGVLVLPDYTDTIYDPPGLLDYDMTYYWRVDEVNEAEPNSPWKGDTWSFTIRNFVVIEDFEDYNDYPPKEIYNTWVDGWDDPTNGATSGYPAPDFVGGEHYMEGEIVHGGDWSMPLFYDNSVGLSEATRTFDSSLQDWTRDDVITLTLYYYGDAGNDIEPIYIALNNNAVVTNDDPRAVLANEWIRWDILLQDFADQGVNLTSVNSMSIGFGNKANPTSGGSGHVLFDDIRLYRSLPEDVEHGPESIDPGTGNLIVYYDFENDVRDGSGHGRHATADDDPVYVSGPTGFGKALSLDGWNDYVELPINSVISTLTDCTIATWVNWSGQGGAWQRIFDFGNPPAPDETEPMVWMFLSANAPGLFAFSVALEGNAGVQDVTTGGLLPAGWHHVAVTIDSTNMDHTLYLDGKVVGQNTNARHLPSDLGQTTRNWIGRSQWTADAYFNGAVDEFRIYNRVLSDAEILFLMGW